MNDVKITEHENGDMLLRHGSHGVRIDAADLPALEAHYRAKLAAEQQSNLGLFVLNYDPNDSPIEHDILRLTPSGEWFKVGHGTPTKFEPLPEDALTPLSLAAEQPAPEVNSDGMPYNNVSRDELVGILSRWLGVPEVNVRRIWQPATPTPSITDAMVEAAALTTLRRVHCSPNATLDDGPNGDYFRAQARAAIEAALVSPLPEQPTPAQEQDAANLLHDLVEFRDTGHVTRYEQPTPLDPEPWLVTGTTTRTAFQRMYGLMTQFKPRPEFEQDRARYPKDGA